MVMFGIAFYEMDKGYKASRKTAARLETATDNSTKFKTQLDVAKTDVNRIKTLQQNNRREIELLEQKVGALETELEQKLKLLDEKLAKEQ